MLKRGLRSEKLLSSDFRTGVRLPTPPLIHPPESDLGRAFLCSGSEKSAFQRRKPRVHALGARAAFSYEMEKTPSCVRVRAVRVGATVNSCLPMSAPARKTGAHAEKAAANRPAEALPMTAVSERNSALFGGRNSALFSVHFAFCRGVTALCSEAERARERRGEWRLADYAFSYYSEHTRDFLPGALDSHRRGGV